MGNAQTRDISTQVKACPVDHVQVSLDGKELSEIPKGLAKTLKKVHRLSLKKNGLTDLPEDFGRIISTNR